MDEDEQFNQAFGELGISEHCRDAIHLIKSNEAADRDKFSLESEDAEEFTNQVWILLGRYIANNTHLKKIGLDSCQLTDETMAYLFWELRSSKSLQRLDIDGNEFGVSGVRCMIPLLQNSPNLSILYLCDNTHINTECFEVLVSALNGKCVKELHFYDNCNITDISALSSCNLPNLQKLNLCGNKIGRCTPLANILQKDYTSLKYLYLDNTGIDDEGVEILATSLKHNTKLRTLNLQENNNISERGYRAILKVLVDASSIENTYNSNHALIKCNLTDTDTYGEIYSLIKEACDENFWNRDRPDIMTGRAKVIKYHLNSQNRKKICNLQDIEYTSGSIFADIEPVHLPNILALIGERHGQSELHTALIHTAPELLSYIDRKALIDDEMAKNIVQADTLRQQADTLRQQANALMLQASVITAQNDQLSKRREMMMDEEGNSTEGDKKRKVQH